MHLYLGELEIELDRRHKIELRTPELQKAFEKPRATEFQLKQIERGNYYKIYSYG